MVRWNSHPPAGGLSSQLVIDKSWRFHLFIILFFICRLADGIAMRINFTYDSDLQIMAISSVYNFNILLQAGAH